jgi:hypothetical protein
MALNELFDLSVVNNLIICRLFSFNCYMLSFIICAQKVCKLHSGEASSFSINLWLHTNINIANCEMHNVMKLELWRNSW